MARGNSIASGSTVLLGGVLGCYAGKYSATACLRLTWEIDVEIFRLGREITRVRGRHLAWMILETRGFVMLVVGSLEVDVKSW